MSLQLRNTTKVLLLAGTAIYLVVQFLNEKLYYYISPRLGWLVPVGSVVLIWLALAYLPSRQRRAGASEEAPHDHDHDHASWSFLLLAIPVLIGVLVPARPLGASAILNRGVSTDLAAASDQRSVQSLTIASAGEPNVLDWVRRMNENPDPAALNGQKVDVIGFVYRDPRFADNQFLVGRFTLICCVADALAIGLVVETDNASQLPVDSWVQVTGTFQQGTLDGRPMPVVVAEGVVPVEPPAQPYLFQ